MVAILDYGSGNLTSVKTALDRLGEPSEVTSRADEAMAADALILPGVGAFSQAMAALRNSGLAGALQAAKETGKPILGICLGMQALFDGSEEGPGTKGLGFIPGTVRKLPGGTNPFSGRPLKIPHMGWNTLRFTGPNPLQNGLPDGAYVYFVHSYACCPEDERDILAVCEYGVRFCAAVRRGSVFGTQFHPEKSGKTGERVLAGFLDYVKRGNR